MKQRDNRLRILQAVADTGALLSSERDIERLLQEIVERARAVFGAEGATIFVKEADALRFAAFSNPVLAAAAPARPKASHYKERPLPVGPGSIAGYTAFSGEILSIEDPYDIPPDRPYTFDSSFDEASGYRTTNIVSLPLARPSGDVVGVLQLVNLPAMPAGEDMDALRAFSGQAAAAVENANLIRNLEETRYEMITRLAAAAEFRDKDTGEHLRRMSRYSCAIARVLGWDEERVTLLEHASPLHDIGKIAVPDSVLLKPGRLDDAEWEIMRKHTVFGAEILRDGRDELTRMSCNIALRHHERFDGKGYPDGVSGKDIPEEARIVSLADVYDALTSKRPYKEPFPHEKALEIIREGTATGQFDPETAEAFFIASKEFAPAPQ